MDTNDKEKHGLRFMCFLPPDPLPPPHPPIHPPPISFTHRHTQLLPGGFDGLIGQTGVGFPRRA